MSEAMDRIATLAGMAVSELNGPIVVNSSQLYGSTSQIGWLTTLYNVRAFTSSGEWAAPIVFSAQDGQFSLTISTGVDWRLYVELTSTWPTDRRLHWYSELAGNGPAQGDILPAGGEQWYFATPAIGADGELVVDITAAGVQDPGEEWQVSELRFWMFQ